MRILPSPPPPRDVVSGPKIQFDTTMLILQCNLTHLFYSPFKGALNLQDSHRLEGDDIPNAQFGRTIVRIGDLNQDGFQGTANILYLDCFFFNLTLSVPKTSEKKKSFFQISFCNLSKNKRHQIVLLHSFHLNGQTFTFHPQTQKYVRTN